MKKREDYDKPEDYERVEGKEAMAAYSVLLLIGCIVIIIICKLVTYIFNLLNVIL